MSSEVAVREVALAGARGLARRGHYAEAEELLGDAWRDAEPSAACLDLLARIHAQQGQLEAADEFWARAQRVAPGEAAYAAGRARIARIRSGSRRPGRVAGVVCVIVLLAGGTAAGWAAGGRGEGRPPAAHPAPRPTASGDVLAALNLNVKGAAVRRTRGELAVTFTHPLFGRRATFTSGARTVLKRLGARLRPYGDRVVVTVIGYTDARPMPRGGPYASNLELGEARAGAVREVLRAAAAMPTSRIAMSSLGGVTGPRARTATLRISADGAR